MKIWSPIFNLFAIVILMFLMISSIYMEKTYNRDFDQARLKIAVEYSSEAAFKHTISSNDNGLDYTNMSNIGVNPSNCIDVFDTLMCYNYNLSTSDINKKTIENSISAMVLGSNDGYYIEQTVYDSASTDTDGAKYNLHWSTKIPYMTVKNNKIYTINIANGTYTIIDSDWSKTTKPFVNSDMTSDLSKEEAMRAVNDMITNSIVQEINQKSLNGESFDMHFNLPTETTKNGVNPIKGPSILVFMKNAQFASVENISALGVSGYQTTDKINIVAYTKNENKYYCYDGQLPTTGIESGNYNVIKYYETMKDAAADGYYPDYERLTQPIVKASK